MIDFQIKKELTRIGLNQQECELLSHQEAVQYLRFYNKKSWQKSSITLIGFTDNEKTSLLMGIDTSYLKVYKNISQDINFICLSEKGTKKQFEKAQKTFAVILSADDFVHVFSLEYQLANSTALYNLNVPKDFRIAIPLSNFNENVEVESLSEANENCYSTNLHKMTCSCNEFISRNKSIYPRGDLRRLCKHLIHLYKNTFGVYSVSCLAQCVFNEGYGFAHKFHRFKIDNVSDDVIVNFDREIGWWDLYVPDKQGKYIKYGYSTTERRFSYNSKPIGIVPQLRAKLIALEKENTLTVYKTVTPSLSKAPNGCMSMILVLLIIGTIIVSVVLKA